MAKIRVNITVDENLKSEATELFNYLGLDFSTAVSLFLFQAVEEWAIPFKIQANSLHKLNRKSRKALKEVNEHISGKRKLERYESVDDESKK